MPRFFAVLIFTFCYLNLQAQTINADSLLVAILSRPDDTVKVVQLNDFATTIRETDPNKALRFAEEAKAMANKLKYRKSLGAILENIGWIHYRKGNYSKALTYSAEALKISQEFLDKRGIASSLNNIAAINYEQKQYAEAIRNFRKGYESARQMGDKGIMSRSLNNIAISFLELKQLDSAEYFTQRSIQFSESVDDQFRAAFGRRTMGDIQFEKEQYEEALRYYFEALKRSEQQKNNFLKTSTLHRIGKTYLAQKNYDKALQYLEMNKSIAEQYGYQNELERTYRLLSEVYRATNDYEMTVFYQDRYIILHDSLYSQRSNEQISLQQVKYESDMQQAQINLLTKDAMLREGELNEQRIWNYIFMIGMGVLATIGFILYFGNRKVKRVNQELHERNEMIRAQATQLKELNATKDKLFSIIGHDLRSPLASLRGLMTLADDSNLTKEEFAELSRKLKINLDYVSDDLDNLLSWARTQLKGLIPNYTLISAHRMVEEKFNLYAEAARIKDITLDNQVPEEIEIIADQDHLKLIMRNLISNAIKFCHPGGKVTATAKLEKGKVIFAVTDDGQGMSEHELNRLFSINTHFSKPGTKSEKGLGLGLLLVKEFVEKNKGTISVKSQLNKGTTFTIVLQGHKVLQEAF